MATDLNNIEPIKENGNRLSTSLLKGKGAAALVICVVFIGFFGSLIIGCDKKSNQQMVSTPVSQTTLPAQDYEPSEISKSSTGVVPELSAEFFEAVKAGNSFKCKELISKGVDVNARTSAGSTALILASFAGKKEVVQTLIKANADLNAKDKHGKTPLIWAAVLNYPEVAKALIDAKADLNAGDNEGVTALMQASLLGRNEIVQALITAKADVNAKEKEYGRTALMMASSKEVIQILKEAGAN
jgi:ankyrin repeat protein